MAVIKVMHNNLGMGSASPLCQAKSGREIWHETNDGHWFAVSPEDMQAVRYGEYIDLKRPTDAEMLETAWAMFECWNHNVRKADGIYDPHKDGGPGMDSAAVAECRKRGIDVSEIDAAMAKVRGPFALASAWSE